MTANKSLPSPLTLAKAHPTQARTGWGKGFLLIFLVFHLKQLGDVEETVAHEETEVAADLGEEGELGVADKFCCHLSFYEIEGCIISSFRYSFFHMVVLG